ncbi:MAG TPA: hypothetical protein VHL57_06840, partial [Flavobacteriales bacterium]|jgi:SAM-dependent methyltransferase|nr:hypothetical protein [Flavobacteriales bacterium]
VFTLDPHLHAGCYYVQEASSMLLEQAVRAGGPWPMDTVALDLCAAPGGKSTHVASLLPEDALLISNEPVRARQGALLENTWKWGRTGTVVTGDRPEAFLQLGAFADLIVVDAPCSGEGMFRKEPFARTQWNDGLVQQCAAQQRSILESAWELLRPGGLLIYSTCTWEERENEQQVQRLQEKGAVFLPLPIDPAWGIVASDQGYRCYPHRLEGEGFFLAALRKPGERSERSTRANEAHLTGEQAEWCASPEKWAASPTEEVRSVHPVHASTLVRALQNTGHVLTPGTPLAERKGNAWRPHSAWALANGLKRGAFPELALDKDHALRYLRGEALNLPTGQAGAETAEGVSLVTYAGHPLGWVQGAGRRWNNRWPASWRIRMR